MPRRNLPPGFIVPCAPELRDVPPAGPDWLHEIKYDGWRMIARVDGSTVNLWSRVGRDWTDAFTAIRAAVAALPVQSVTIDGEAVYHPGDRTLFHGLRSRSGQAEAALVAFDLLMLDDEDLRPLPIEVRRARLAGLIRAPGGIVLSEEIDGDGPTVFRHACELGLEGIVSKRRGSRYRSGPTSTWRKVRCDGYRR